MQKREGGCGQGGRTGFAARTKLCKVVRPNRLVGVIAGAALQSETRGIQAAGFRQVPGAPRPSSTRRARLNPRPARRLRLKAANLLYLSQ
jgi:hypothetical protein